MRALCLGLVLACGLIGPAFAQGADDAQGCVSEGDKDVDKTVAACTRVLGSDRYTDKERAQFFYNRGVAHGLKGDDTSALADYNRAIGIEQNDPSALNNRGLIRMRRGEWGLALADFNYAIKIAPSQSLLYTNRGLLHIRQGQYQLAIDDETRAIARDPQNAVAYANRAEARGAMNDFDGALADFSMALRIDPKTKGVYRRRGDAFLENGDPVSAILDYNEAIAIMPDDASAWGNRGAAYLQQNMAEEGVADLRKAFALDPKNVTALSNIGGYYAKQGDSERAMANWARALELDPAHSLTLRNRALYRATKGDLDGALADYDLAIRAEPDRAMTYFHRGKVRGMRQEMEQALSDFDKAIELGKIPGAYYDRAATNFRMARYPQALADISEAEKLGYQDEEMARRRGVILEKLEDWQGALALYVKARDQKPDDLALWRNVAHARYQLRDYAQALADYDEAARRGDGSIHRARGMAYATLGRHAEAAADFDKAMVDLPQDHYSAIWRYLMRRHAGLAPDGLRDGGAGLDMTKWPAAVLRFYRGEIDADAMRAAAQVGPEDEIAGQVCEADFYLAEDRLLGGDKGAATPLLQAALTGCPTAFYETHIARALLEPAKP